jgi:Tfp pilus assembly protein PilO
MKLAKRYRQMIYAAAICIAAVLVTMTFGVNPMIDSANNATLETDQNDGLLNVEISRIHHLEGLVRNKAAVDAQLAAYEYSMPEEAHVSEMVDSLNSAANSNGLVVTSLTVGDPEKYVVPTPIHKEADLQPSLIKASASLKDIPVTLAVDGNFSALVAFLNDVQNSERVTLVRSLQLQPGLNPDSYTLQISAYVFTVFRK